jgi:hypothetical protein
MKTSIALLAGAIFLTSFSLAAADDPSLDATVGWIAKRVNTSAGGDVKIKWSSGELDPQRWSYVWDYSTTDKALTTLTETDCTKHTADRKGNQDEYIETCKYKFNLADVSGVAVGVNSKFYDSPVYEIQIQAASDVFSYSITDRNVTKNISTSKSGNRSRISVYFTSEEMRDRVANALTHAVKKAKENDLGF